MPFPNWVLWSSPPPLCSLTPERLCAHNMAATALGSRFQFWDNWTANKGQKVVIKFRSMLNACKFPWRPCPIAWSIHPIYGPSSLLMALDALEALSAMRCASKFSDIGEKLGQGRSWFVHFGWSKVPFWVQVIDMRNVELLSPLQQCDSAGKVSHPSKGRAHQS